MNSADLVALGLLALQVGFVLIMVVYLIAGLDDLFIDLTFFALTAMRWLGLSTEHYQPTLDEMGAKPEQPFALMFPAWQESEVIRRALMNTISNIAFTQTELRSLFGQVVAPRMQQPYTRQTNIGWAHQLTASTALTVDALHIEGRDLWTVRLTGKAKMGDKTSDLPIEFVVVGHVAE